MGGDERLLRFPALTTPAGFFFFRYDRQGRWSAATLAILPEPCRVADRTEQEKLYAAVPRQVGGRGTGADRAALAVGEGHDARCVHPVSLDRRSDPLRAATGQVFVMAVAPGGIGVTFYWRGDPG